MGVEGVLHPGAVQLGRGHDGGDGGVHLQRVPQLRPGEVHRHQGKAGGTVAAHPHGQHVKDLGDGDVPGGQGSPENAVCRDGHRDLGFPARRPVRGVGGVQKGVGHQLSQGITLLDAGAGGGEGKV